MGPIHVCNSAPLCWFLLLSPGPTPCAQTLPSRTNTPIRILKFKFPVTQEWLPVQHHLHSVQGLLVCSRDRACLPSSSVPFLSERCRIRDQGWHLTSVLVLSVPSQWPGIRMSKLHHSDINPSQVAFLCSYWDQVSDSSLQAECAISISGFLKLDNSTWSGPQLQCPCCGLLCMHLPLVVTALWTWIPLFTYHIVVAILCLLCSWSP